MNWTSLITKDKELSSLSLDEPDTTYQVWELGRLMAEIWGKIDDLRRASEMDDAAQIESAKNKAKEYASSLGYLCNRLRKGLLQFQIDLTTILTSVSQVIDSQNLKPALLRKVLSEIEEWRHEIGYDLRSKSVHLANIFACSHSLIMLRLKLLQEIHSDDVETYLSASIENLEKLERGDKVLTSPNLQLTSQNLRIVEARLRQFHKHLDELQSIAKRDPEKYRETIYNRSEMLEYLILDIKNPLDYLSRKRRWLVNSIPVLSFYYFAVAPVIILFSVMPKIIESGENGSIVSIIILLLTGLIPIYIAFLAWVYGAIKNYLIISSFQFKLSQYKNG